MKPTRRLAVLLSVGLALSVAPGVLVAQSADMQIFPPATGLRAPAPPPLRLAERPGVVPLAELRAAIEVAGEDLAALAAWNRAGRLPVRNGFARALASPRRVSFGPELEGRASGAHAGGLFERAGDGSLAWGAEVRAAGAHRLRLHLAELNLPVGSELWIYGAHEAMGPFGLEQRGPEGDLWTPSVGGEAIRLEVRLPAGAGAAGFVVDRVLETFRLDLGGTPQTGMSLRGIIPPCLVDVQCVGTGTFDVVDLAQQAIAAIEFIDGGLGFLCSGGLLNDLDTSSVIPFFLTANHCFDNQAAASTVEAFWDYYTPSCNGTPPDPGTLPRSNGSTLLATGSLGTGHADYTLVRLASIPTNRVLLGWNANASAAAHNTVLNRISHPMGFHQHYSRDHVDTTAPTCGGAPRPTFLYETFFPGMGDMGGTFGGSSGSPVILAGGQVVGQLTGGCGPNPSDGCDYDNAEVDGAFSESFDDPDQPLQPYLTGAGCLPGPTTLCLAGGRFQVEMVWRSSASSPFADAQAIDFGSDNSGLFYFLNPNNAEVLLKVLNACTLNDRYWVFFAATTNVEFTITVTDTQSTGVPPKTYFNPLGNPAAPIQDTSAFATCP
jgi:hypothetical protein